MVNSSRLSDASVNLPSLFQITACQEVLADLKMLSAKWKPFCHFYQRDGSLICVAPLLLSLNTLRPRQDGRLFPDDIFKSIFFNENAQIAIKVSLTFVPKAPINNISVLVQIMAWRHSGDKPLSEPMMVSLPMHICVARPQWVNMSLYFCSSLDRLPLICQLGSIIILLCK